MKTLIRLVTATLALHGVPQLASAQSTPPPDPPQAPDSPASDAMQPPATPPPAPAPPPAAATAVPGGPEWTSLRLLRDKGVISDAELASALRDIGVVGAGDATTLVVAKLKTTIYGYLEGNYKYDTTQTCVEFCGNTQVQRPDTYRGNHGRSLFSARDSRLGIRLAAPEQHGIRVSGVLETDF